MASSYSRLKRSGRLGSVTALMVGAVIILPVNGANAAPESSASAAKKKLEKLNGQVDKLANKYDKSKTQLDAAKKRLGVIKDEVAAEKPQYQNLRDRVAQMAVAAYKNGTLDSTTFLASKDPGAALEDMSTFVELSSNRSQEMTALLASAQRLQRDQEEAQATLQTVTAATSALKKQKVEVEKAIAKQKALLPKTGSSESASGGSASGGGSSSGATGSARKAVDYATTQLGKPYVFGGTGPAGYDCSGLTMMAWRAAGVSLPRVVPDQYDAIRHVAKSALRPGDLVFFDSLGHEGIYIGGGRFIHAPHTGTDVQYASMSNPYWVSHYVGAGRP